MYVCPETSSGAKVGCQNTFARSPPAVKLTTVCRPDSVYVPSSAPSQQVPAAGEPKLSRPAIAVESRTRLTPPTRISDTSARMPSAATVISPRSADAMPLKSACVARNAICCAFCSMAVALTVAFSMAALADDWAALAASWAVATSDTSSRICALAEMSSVSPMAFSAVTRSSGTVADARNASCAEIFPACSAPAKISEMIADAARMFPALRSAMLAVVATICRPSDV